MNRFVALRTFSPVLSTAAMKDKAIDAALHIWTGWMALEDSFAQDVLKLTDCLTYSCCTAVLRIDVHFWCSLLTLLGSYSKLAALSLLPFLPPMVFAATTATGMRNAPLQLCFETSQDIS